MEKSAAASIESSRELQCVGKMEIVKPKAAGFLCGSIPVPTDKSFHAFNSALVPSSLQTVSAPRYRMLPTETDLNTPPLVINCPEKVLPIGAVQSKVTGDIIWEDGAIASNLSRKGEALAVSGLVEYGDEIDVIAPADILKQIFKIPYSKARLSIAVHRVGQTLVLNTGPDIEEGEKLVRRHSSQSKCTDQSLFLNFAMHSVRMEACDCPPTHQAQPERQSDSSVFPREETSNFVAENEDIAQRESFEHYSDYSKVKQDRFFWGGKKGRRNKSHDPIKKATDIGEKPRCSVQESEKHRRVGNNGFLRVLYWQFHNFRMLLGSDLLLFSNEKYAAVSLHLWDVTRQVTPLTWLEAWLDNVMASVPELAICYHQNGVVQGYELLKTDDIFLLKGIAEDGSPAFHPNVVQQNGLSVLRFLQENCKQDPGAYWLYKSSGEDVIQLFDLSVVSKNHSSSDCDDNSSSLPSIVHRGRSDSLFSLGTLLYRIAHRLSLSMASNNPAKCAKFFKKCLDFLDEPDHLVVRAFAHEQFARLILNYDEELDLTSEYLPIDCEVTVTDVDVEEGSVDLFNGFPESAVNDFSLVADDKVTEDGTDFHDLASEVTAIMTLEANISFPNRIIALSDTELGDEENTLPSFHGDGNFMAYNMSSKSEALVQPVADPISSKLAAVHHVSQAIKSLIWMRQLQNSEPQLVNQGIAIQDQLPSSMNFSCACGDADCIEVCDIREWLPTSKLDHKLWKLVLLLGESYLALGQAYKEDGQLHQALRIVELACSVYGSMPRQLEDTKFISSIVKCSPSNAKFNDRDNRRNSFTSDVREVKSKSAGNCFIVEQFPSTYLFWANAWTLVGDVHVEFHIIKGKEISAQAEKKPSTRELKMSSEVVKELQRLKKKLGQYNQNCSSCSLVNCSCQSDRASSGNSASSSGGDTQAASLGRKHGKRSRGKNVPTSLLGDGEDRNGRQNVKNRQIPDDGQFQDIGDGDNIVRASSNTSKDDSGVNSMETINSKRALFEMHDKKSEAAHQNENSEETPKLKDGGIFKYLRNTVVAETDAEHNLLSSLRCYEEAIKALGELPSGSADLQSVLKKKGWVCNELGRNRLALKELKKAELAFADAINAFRGALDYTNIILIYCNLGHGRRALAEEMVTKMEGLKMHAVFQNAYKQVLETAKLEYSESLRYYGAAKLEMNAIVEEAYSVSTDMKNDVYTQFAHTYLRLGMLLAREDMIAEVYENGTLEAASVPNDRRARKEPRKHEITANEAIREALSVYELLGESRKQEAAYAYFQLACYQRDCCLKFLASDHKKTSLPKGENGVHQRVKQYASLADRNWQKAIDFYGSQTHPSMYLTILIERSSLSLNLASYLHANMMLDALSHLLEARHVSESFSKLFKTHYPELHAKFWCQLQMLLKKMLAVNLSVNKSTSDTQPVTSNRFGDAGKLRELYKMSLSSTELTQLHAMHTLWSS